MDMEKETLRKTQNDASSSPVKDLTKGSPMKLILGFALPMLLGLLFQQFYNMVDTMIVGKYLGLDAFAGVGSTGCLNFLVIGFCIGICSGFSVLVAQRFGAKDYTGLRKTVSNCTWLSIIFSVILTTCVVVYCKPILRLMNTPEDVFDYAYTYIVIIFAGIPCIILYNMTASILRALGDSKSPVVFLAFSSILNIGLDLLFILTFKMNVEGAAIATVTSQGISGLICLIYMKVKFKLLKSTKDEKKFRPSYAAKLCGIGIPMGLQYSITAVGTIVIQTAVNGLGSLYIAGVTAGSRLNMFLSCPMEALGQTMAPYAGQNVGAGKIDRVGKGLKASSLCGIILSIVLFIVVLLFGKEMSLLFIDKEKAGPKVIQYSYQWLLTSVGFYFLLTLVNTVRFTIQGMGYSTFAILAGILEMIARTLAGILLVPLTGFWGICFANPLAWIFADLFLIPAYFLCIRKLKRRYAPVS